MLASDDPRIGHLNHLLRVAQGAGDRQVDRFFEISRLVSDLIKDGLDDPTVAIGPRVGLMAQIAQTLRIEDHIDGTVWFAFDLRNEFKLAPRLADLLTYLASASADRAGSTEHLVGFRSRADILAFLEETAGKKFRRQYLNNLVNLLKDALRRLDGRILVVTDRRKGIRLLLKHGGLKRTSAPNS
jgi:hypothetical protein